MSTTPAAEMQVTETARDGLRHAFAVAIDGARILALRDERLAEIAGAVAMPGFPRGEAPWSLVVQRYGSAVLGEVIEREVAEVARRLPGERGLRPALPPGVRVGAFTEGGDLDLHVEFEALPEIAVPDLPRLRLERLRAEPGEAEVARALADLAVRHGGFEEVAPRPAARGEVLVCDHLGRLPVDLLRNGPGHGAMAGQPGLPPADWSIDVSEGLQREILATGREAGMPFLDLRLHGTTRPGGFLRVFTARPNGLPARPGEVLTLCIRARLTDGALPEGAVPRLGFNERSDTGFLRALRGRVELGPEELRTRFTMGDNPALTHARPLFELDLRPGQAVDVTLRIGPARVFPGAEEPEGVAFPAGFGQDREIAVGGEDLAPGFAEQLDGMAPGEARAIELVFPPDHPAPELAGQRARFAVTARALKLRRPCAVDEALARRLGHADLPALAEALRAGLHRDCEAASRARIRRAVLDSLAAIARFPVPQGLVEQDFRRIRQRLQADRRAAGNLPRNEAAWREAYLGLAERRVRLALLIGEIARAEGLAVSEEELARAMRREAARHPGQEAQVLAFFRRNADAAEALRGPLLEDKVIELMVARAEVTERQVAPGELVGGSLPGA